MATVLILVGFVVVLALALVILIPILAHQLADFVGRLPEYLDPAAGADHQLRPAMAGEDASASTPQALREGLNSLLTAGVGFITTVFAVDLGSRAWRCSTSPACSWSRRSSPSTCCSTGTAWSPRSTAGCRATMSTTVRAIASDINTSTAGFVRGQGTLCLILGIYLCDRADGHRPQFRHPDRPVRRADQLHPLCRLAGRAGAAVGVAFVQFWPDWIMVVRGGLRVLHRPVHRGQHPAAAAGRQERRPASGLADVRAVCLRCAVRLRRPADRRAGRGGRRRPGALRHRPLSGIAALQGPGPADRPPVRRRPRAAAKPTPEPPMPDADNRRASCRSISAMRTGRSRDDLVVSRRQSAAVALIDRWPDWPSPVVVLAGPAGSGKTHLGADLARDGRRRRRSIGGQASAPRPSPSPARGRVFIDDADRPGLDETGLFHVVNAVRGRRHAPAADRPRRFPSAWGVALPDLASRLKAAATVEIREPDDLLLAGVITKLFADRQVEVEPHVVQFLVRRIERSLSTAITRRGGARPRRAASQDAGSAGLWHSPCCRRWKRAAPASPIPTAPPAELTRRRRFRLAAAGRAPRHGRLGHRTGPARRAPRRGHG